MAVNPTFFEDEQSPSSGDGSEGATDQEQGSYSLETFKDWWKMDAAHSAEWRQEARRAFDIVAGTQWIPEDLAYLKLQLRPTMTFNRIAPVIDSVSGLEVNNRQQVCFFPRHIGDSGVNELLTGAAKWVRDECEAEDEESEAFLDLIICGMGWTDTRVSYDEDLDGKGIIERVDPLEMYADGSATKKNLSDARHVFRVRDVPLAVAEDMFEGIPAADLHAGWAADTASDAHSPHDAQQAPYYRIDQSGELDRQKTKVRLVEVQWWEHESIWRMADPVSGKELRLNEEKYQTLIKRFQQMGMAAPDAVRQKHKCYYKAFLGNKVLQSQKGPEEGGFTLKCMTGKRDRNKGTFYGMVRAMIDPQMWANKWLSQILHLINTNAKGGLFAELDAFENPQQAREEYARGDTITFLRKGALAAGKVKEKPVAQFPAGIQQLMEFAISSIRDVSGVNLELLGGLDRNQPGILEHQRKQAAMTILAGSFDSLRRYRKEQGRSLLFIITRYLSNGRLIRIGGPEEAKYVPLVRQPDTVKYDVIVDDTPNSVNIKEQTWGALTQMMPILRGMPIPPQIWLSILKYSPIPSALVGEISGIIQQQQGQPHQDPHMVAAQAKVQAVQQEGQLDQQRLQADTAMEQTRMRADMALEQQKISLESSARIKELLLEYMLKERQAARDEHQAGHERALDLGQFVQDNRRADAELKMKADQMAKQPTGE